MNLSLSRRAAPALRLPTSVRMLLGTLAVAVVAGFAQPAFAQPMGPHGAADVVQQARVLSLQR